MVDSLSNSKDAILNSALNRISRDSALGEFEAAITNSLYGLNYRGVGNAALNNTEQHGLTFFTRPCLNLSYDNIKLVRTFVPLLTNSQYSYQRAIRTLLDPRGANERSITCPLIDNRNPFIAVLTNNLISLSGWPDLDVDVYTTKPGVSREEFSMIDGYPRILNAFDLTANFRNIKGDPITLLFNTWVMYAARVYRGDFDPYPEMILENTIDYNTRIYRLTLDPTRQYVQKIAATGAAFPTVSPLGAAFNFTEEQPFTREADQLSIRFRCMGAEYLDPIIIKEFNELVLSFNPSMRDEARRSSYYKKLTLAERSYFNYRGLPLINPDSNELEIWVDRTMYNTELNAG